MITSTIESYKEWDVAIVDIPWEFLHAHTDELIYIILRGTLAELMVMIDPVLYKDFITYYLKGQSLMYVRMNKALYGMLKSAFQFYLKFRSDIEAYGFKVKRYGPCVNNADINGNQMTVTWHVDDLKVSHKDPFEIIKFAHYLSIQYGKKTTVKRGKVHEYLGMDLDYSRKGAVKVGMIKYLQNV